MRHYEILITGANGLIGTALQQYLNRQGHTVKPLIRGARFSKQDQPCWDIQNNFIDFKAFELDVVIHLAGENLAQRWTKVHKASLPVLRVFVSFLCGPESFLPNAGGALAKTLFGSEMAKEML